MKSTGFFKKILTFKKKSCKIILYVEKWYFMTKTEVLTALKEGKAILKIPILRHT